MRDFNWTDTLWCVVKENGSFAGIPCVSLEEAIELSNQHEGSKIYKMEYNWENNPFGSRFLDDEPNNIGDDCGFDPYMGCFTDDC